MNHRRNSPIGHWDLVIGHSAFGIAICLALFPSAATADEYDQSAPYWYANPADVAAWRQLKFGLFVHWGPAAVSGKDISWARQGRGRFGPGEIPNEVYDNLYKQFNPVKYDPRDWVRVAQSAGMRYLVFTSKHHDGFCNFDTQQGDYKITSPASPYGKDVVRPLADACHAAGLKFGLYYSQVDWHHPDFKTKNHARYLKYYQGQIRELLSNYGRVDMLWFDNLGHGGEFGGDARDSAADEVFQLARGLQPHLLINDRCGVPGDFATPEQRVGKYNFTEPWESCFKLAGQYWSWEADAKVLPLTQCVDLLVRCVAGDGNLLLNVGPRPDGQIEPAQAARLAEIGQWLKRNGTAIYNTRGGPLPPAEWGGTTQRDKTIFVHVLRWPEAGLKLPPLKHRVVSATLLGDRAIQFEQTPQGVSLEVKAADRDPLDTIVALTLDGPARDALVTPPPTSAAEDAPAKAATDPISMLGAPDRFLGTCADWIEPGKNRYSPYRALPLNDHLTFEVGNGELLAAIQPRGRVEAARIFTGDEVARGSLPGVWRQCTRQERSFGKAAPLRWTVEVGDQRHVLDDEVLGQDMSLAGGCWPLLRTALGKCRVAAAFVAPVDDQGRPVRALLMLLRVQPAGEDRVQGFVVLPSLATPAGSAGKQPAGVAEVLPLDKVAAEASGDGRRRIRFDLQPGQRQTVAVALLMGENADELPATRERIFSHSTADWVRSTVAYYNGRLPRLSVDGQENPLGSMWRRMQFCELITPLITGGDEPVGSSWGTLLYQKDSVWMTDTLLNYLGAGLAEPQQWLNGARYFAFRSLPGAEAREFWKRDKHYRELETHDLADRRRFTDDERALHSLTNLLAPVILSGTYYRMTGDVAALRAAKAIDPETGRETPLVDRLHALLAMVLESRRADEPWLFRSRWISDGPTRGRYHTGSNIAAWYAFREMARIARAIDPADARGAEYTAIANRIKAAIPQHCSIGEDSTKMWNEGSDLPKFYRDGEESFATLAPALGFCGADEPGLVRSAARACTPENPLWSPRAEALVWPLGKDRYATFPGYLTELASADTDAKLKRKLDKLVALSDADGQWWWWPKLEAKPDRLLRGPAGKCGWAEAVFLWRMSQCNLGVAWDAPDRTLSVRPFLPWQTFACEGLRVGSLKLDYRAQGDAKGTRVEIAHNQERLERLTLTIRAPVGTASAKLTAGPAGATLRKAADYFGAPTWEVTIDRPQEQTVSMKLEWQTVPSVH